MKKIILSAFFITFCAGFAMAAPYDAFDYVLNETAYYYNDVYMNPKQGEKLAQKYLDAFTKDVGQAISGGSYGIGGNIGISDLNLMLSLKMSYQETLKDNNIVRRFGETAITYPILHAEMGFAERYDAITRVSYFNNSALFGGGLRYKVLISEDEMYVPSVFVQSLYTYVVCDDNDYGKFNAWNLKTGTTAYFGQIPHIQPYMFITYDITALKPITSYYSYLSSYCSGFGYGAGVNIKMEILNISVSVSMYDGQPNISFGVFVGI